MVYLFAIVLIQFAYLVWITHLFSQERDRLETKLMSRDATEYAQTVKELENTGLSAPQEEKDRYLDLEDVSTEELLKAEDNL